MMTASTQKTVKLGLLVTLVMLVFVLIVGIDAYQKLRRQPGLPSTYNARSAGYKALYLWLRLMGVPANRWESPLTELPQEAEVLLIMSPRFGPGPGELKVLENWVRGGGTLVLVASKWNAFAEHFGLDMKGGVPGGKKPDGKGSQSFQPGPYIRGQRTITVKTHPEIESKKPQAISHMWDSLGNLIMAMEEGKGRVIMIADPSLFSNFHLREGDHARLALDLVLTHLGTGLLLIDEYHHGHGRVSSVAGYLFQSEAFVPTIQVGFLLFLIWAAVGRRFGPARSLSRETDRSSMEYVSAMARLFQRVKARRLSLESVLRWFDEEARRLLLDKDPGFQRRMEEAKKRLALESMTDRDLVNVVRNLYEALSRARNKAL